ncbi:MAG: DUF1566 domain-containing protein [Gammaproteobacteria bacterium]|nr:DUF1566 domain-containing protein [Gammaproteobacteria bacterium]
MTTLNTCARYVLTALLCGVLTACGGGDDAPAPPPGTPGSTVLTRTSAEASGVNCTNGGTRVEAGIDANSSGTLDATEISSISYVCSTPGTPPAPGAVVLTTTSAEPSGVNCTNGGTRVEAGIDANSNGALDATEISTTTYLCSTPGAPAAAVLINTRAEPNGVNCASGGTKVEAGTDANSNGTLDAAEVSTTSYLCNPVTRVALPKTGQTTCYDATNAPVPCTTPGIPPRQDGALQTGVAAPSPRLALGSGATADCVTDTLTGLMWPRNANPSGTLVTWQQALDFANNLTLCGFSDWRLPNKNELYSLYTYDVTTPTDQFLHNLGFNNVINNPNLIDGFWSSSSYTGDPAQAWIMTPTNLFPEALTDKDLGGLRIAWPVRAGQTAAAPARVPATGQAACYNSTGAPIFCGGTGQDGDIKAGVPWPSPRFTVNSPGTEDCLTDNLTGLMWARAFSAPAGDWFTAMTHAGNLTLCGYSDWRLPNVRELESLVHQGINSLQVARYFQAQGFLVPASFLTSPNPNPTSLSMLTWSSSSSSSYAWFISMGTGTLNTNTRKTTPGLVVWPVRGGQ